MMHMLEATTLSTTNTAKFLELEEELANSLRDAVAGREELEVASLTDDETRTLASICARLAVLCKSRDMTTWMEEDEGGKQSSVWNIISALLERATLGYEEEEKVLIHLFITEFVLIAISCCMTQMMVDCIDILAMHVIWRFGAFASSPDDSAVREDVIAKRDALLEKFTDFAVGANSRVCEEAKRAVGVFISHPPLSSIHQFFYDRHSSTFLVYMLLAAPYQVLS
jgi:cohesin complex subunit SA-1/2